MEVLNGWCFAWERCRGIGVECVSVPHGSEYAGERCVQCLGRALGLGEEATAGAVVAELMRRAA